MPGSQTICSVFPQGLTHAFLSSFSLSVFSSKAGSLHSLRCAGDAVGTSVPWEGRTPSSCSTVIGLHSAQPYQGQRCSTCRLGQKRRWWHLLWFSLQQKQRNNQEEASLSKPRPCLRALGLPGVHAAPCSLFSCGHLCASGEVVGEHLNPTSQQPQQGPCMEALNFWTALPLLS